MTSTPAALAAIAPETAFQEFTRSQALRFTTEIPLPVAAAPVIDEVLSLVGSAPDAERRHCAPDGSWTSIGLASGDMHGGSVPEPAMSRMPRVTELLAAFGGCVGFCTIARIAPGDLLDWHYDMISADVGKTRLHFPVVTTPAAVTDFCHDRVHWPAGTLHYGDYGFPHRVFNTGAIDRIHLYFDVAAEKVLAHLSDELTAPRHRLRDAAQGLMHAARAAT